MKARTPIFLAGVSALAIAGSVAMVSAAPLGSGSTEHAQMRHLGMAKDAHPAHFRVHRGARGEHTCGERAAQHTERMIGVVEGLMTFSSPQQTAWNELTKTVRDSRTSFTETCKSVVEGERPTTAQARMERMEKLMAARLDMMRSIRPAFETFYGTLNETQQKAIDDLFTGHHRGRH
jgi:hypothetical protein